MSRPGSGGAPSQLQSCGACVWELQVWSVPSLSCCVSSQTAMVVVPDGFSTSASVWMPSPFVSRYMYWAVTEDGRHNAAQMKSAVKIENRTRSRVRFMIETSESFRLGGVIGSGEWDISSRVVSPSSRPGTNGSPKGRGTCCLEPSTGPGQKQQTKNGPRDYPRPTQRSG